MREYYPSVAGGVNVEQQRDRYSYNTIAIAETSKGIISEPLGNPQETRRTHASKQSQ